MTNGAAGAARARRLVLSAAEYAALVNATGSDAPAGFSTSGVTAEESAAGTAALAGRGVLVEADSGTYRLVDSVAVNLAVLVGPTVLIQVEVSAGERGLRSVFAVSGSLGASLLTVLDGGVELSMFPATALGVELIRAVPVPEQIHTGRSRIAAALGGDDNDGALLAGRLPLAALESGAGHSDPGTKSTAEQAELAEELVRHTAGLLSCLVTGRIGEGLVVGEVVWLATGTGWVGLRPDPDRDGTRMVVVGPVDRAALGTWVAPYVAEILDAAR